MSEDENRVSSSESETDTGGSSDEEDVVEVDDEKWTQIKLKKASTVHLKTVSVAEDLLEQCEREWRAVLRNVSCHGLTILI